MKGDTGGVTQLNWSLRTLTSNQHIKYPSHIHHRKFHNPVWVCPCKVWVCEAYLPRAVLKGVDKRKLVWCTLGLKLHVCGFDFWAKICILIPCTALPTAVLTSSSPQSTLHISFKAFMFCLVLSSPRDSHPRQCYCPCPSDCIENP